MKTKVYKIEGMDCASCASLLEMDLEDIGINAKCSYAKSILEVQEDHDKKKVYEVIKKSGFKIAE